MKRAREIGLLIVLTFAVRPCLQAAEPPMRSATLGSDLFAAASTVRPAQAVAGDALLAGREVDSTVPVGGDLVVAGAELQIAGTVGHDLYAAGRRVRLEGAVTDNARVAGNEVIVARVAHFGGGLSLAAQRVEFDGQARGYLSAAAATIRINGQVDGNVDVAGGDLELGPQAVIGGRLTFRGPRPPVLASGSRVTGGVQFIPQQPARTARYRGLLRPAAWVWLLGWMIAGGVLIAMWPAFTRAASETTASRALQALGVGVLALVVTPAVILVLFVTMLGVPLALLLLAAYLLILPLGYLTAAAAISDRALLRLRGAGGRNGQRAMILALTLLVLFIITRLPLLGPLLRLLLLLWGLGGLVLAGHAARDSDKRPSAAA